MSGATVACLTQQVLEHGGSGPRRMHPLRHLSQLERIAEQDEVAGRRTHGEGVRERHLARLVDHERVDERAPCPDRRRGPVGRRATPCRAKSRTSRAGARERSHLVSRCS